MLFSLGWLHFHSFTGFVQQDPGMENEETSPGAATSLSMQAWAQLFLPLPLHPQIHNMRLDLSLRGDGEALPCTSSFVPAAAPFPWPCSYTSRRRSQVASQEHPSLEPATLFQLSTTFFVGTSGKTMEICSLEPPGLSASILSPKSWLGKLFSQYFPCSVCRRV